MIEIDVRNVRLFRLAAHHLAGWSKREQLTKIVGVCGMQNSPPGAWETALHQRLPDCSLAEIDAALYTEKELVQAWSFRGAPVVFPVAESSVFLSSLVPDEEEEWIYTHGIGAALEYLQMDFDDVLEKLRQVMPGLNDKAITSKVALDRVLAEWMLPLLPAEKREAWNAPSMYGRPDVQSVGGAVVSFLLRPCSFLGLIVFGERLGGSPRFTSYESWLGRPLRPDPEAGPKLVRAFLHGYGPTTVDAFMHWLGCSKQQARRLWAFVADDMQPVRVLGKEAYVLAEDMDALCRPALPQRELLLLGGHDPYLDQRDRQILLADKSLQKQVWRTVTNPGAIVRQGEIIGIWTSRKKAKGMEVKMTLWNGNADRELRQNLADLAEAYAAFRQLDMIGFDLECP